MTSHSVEFDQISTMWRELLATVKAGGEVILTDHDVPLARLAPLTIAAKRKPGLHLRDFKMSADFNEELPDEYWLGKE